MKPAISPLLLTLNGLKKKGVGVEQLGVDIYRPVSHSLISGPCLIIGMHVKLKNQG